MLQVHYTWLRFTTERTRPNSCGGMDSFKQIVPFSQRSSKPLQTSKRWPLGRDERSCEGKTVPRVIWQAFDEWRKLVIDRKHNLSRICKAWSKSGATRIITARIWLFWIACSGPWSRRTRSRTTLIAVSNTPILTHSQPRGPTTTCTSAKSLMRTTSPAWTISTDSLKIKIYLMLVEKAQRGDMVR